MIFLLSKQLSRVFSSTAIQKHQFFGSQPSLCSHFAEAQYIIALSLFSFLWKSSAPVCISSTSSRKWHICFHWKEVTQWNQIITFQWDLEEQPLHLSAPLITVEVGITAIAFIFYCLPDQQSQGQRRPSRRDQCVLVKCSVWLWLVPVLTSKIQKIATLYSHRVNILCSRIHCHCHQVALCGTRS